MTGVVPAFSDAEKSISIPNGSTTNYQLLDAQNTVLAPDEELSGASATAASYEVAVTANNEYGYVSGGGTYIHGAFAEVTAYPMPGGSLIGWYQDDQLVSTEETYRFAVKENTHLEARFTEVETYQLTVLPTEGGTVSNETILVPAGAKVSLEAIADPGYVFSHWSADGGIFENSVSAHGLRCLLSI